jgi:outer membrane protein insertion porin family
VFGVKRPPITSLEAFRDPTDNKIKAQCRNQTTGQITFLSGDSCPDGSFAIQPFGEAFLGDTPKPRVSVGFGVNWNSPFGPFRIDIAKALIKERGDDPQLVTFNVGTQF